SDHYSATIDWGDGSGLDTGVVTYAAAAGMFSVLGNHTYAEEGTSYVVTVTIYHELSNPQQVTSTAYVTDVPVIASGVPVNATEAQAVTPPTAPSTDPAAAEPNAADPDPATVAGHYSASIDWGDGSAVDNNAVISYDATTGKFSVHGTHIYADEGKFTV